MVFDHVRNYVILYLWALTKAEAWTYCVYYSHSLIVTQSCSPKIGTSKHQMSTCRTENVLRLWYLKAEWERKHSKFYLLFCILLSCDTILTLRNIHFSEISCSAHQGQSEPVVVLNSWVTNIFTWKFGVMILKWVWYVLYGQNCVLLRVWKKVFILTFKMIKLHDFE